MSLSGRIRITILAVIAAFSLVVGPNLLVASATRGTHRPTDVGCQYNHRRDRDCDGVRNSRDNCPRKANPGQRDSDGDGYGNKCDRFPHNPNKH